ncbi:MAG: BrnT family toxin [Planctomycetota bacterium]
MAYTLVVELEWDPGKARLNEQKHGLSFEEARELFLGTADYLEIYDRTHSLDEDRFIAIGPVQRGLICVVYVERVEDRIRLISARFATRQEHRLFMEYMEGRLP